MTRHDVDRYKELAERVYLLYAQAGLLGCLPRVPELRPELECQEPPLPPVQFVGKLNLRGDWEQGTFARNSAFARLVPIWQASKVRRFSTIFGAGQGGNSFLGRPRKPRGYQ